MKILDFTYIEEASEGRLTPTQREIHYGARRDSASILTIKQPLRKPVKVFRVIYNGYKEYFTYPDKQKIDWEDKQLATGIPPLVVLYLPVYVIRKMLGLCYYGQDIESALQEEMQKAKNQKAVSKTIDFLDRKIKAHYEENQNDVN